MADADRDLLFGRPALQHGLIDHADRTAVSLGLAESEAQARAALMLATRPGHLACLELE